MKEKQFIEWLYKNHQGIENAIKAKNMSQFGNPREIRYMVNSLRKEGFPICSGNVGYYYAKNMEELYQSIALLKAQIEDIEEVVHNLQTVGKNFLER